MDIHGISLVLNFESIKTEWKEDPPGIHAHGAFGYWWYHPISSLLLHIDPRLKMTIACLVQRLLSQTDGRSARALTQAASSQQKK